MSLLDVLNAIVFNAVNTTNEIPFTSIVLGWMQKSQRRVSTPEQIKPKPFAWLDTTRGQWEDMLLVTWVNWPFKHSHIHCGYSLLGKWAAPLE